MKKTILLTLSVMSLFAFVAVSAHAGSAACLAKCPGTCKPIADKAYQSCSVGRLLSCSFKNKSCLKKAGRNLKARLACSIVYKNCVSKVKTLCASVKTKEYNKCMSTCSSNCVY